MQSSVRWRRRRRRGCVATAKEDRGRPSLNAVGRNKFECFLKKQSPRFGPTQSIISFFCRIYWERLNRSRTGNAGPHIWECYTKPIIWNEKCLELHLTFNRITGYFGRNGIVLRGGLFSRNALPETLIFYLEVSTFQGFLQLFPYP